MNNLDFKEDLIKFLETLQDDEIVLIYNDYQSSGYDNLEFMYNLENIQEWLNIDLREFLNCLSSDFNHNDNYFNVNCYGVISSYDDFRDFFSIEELSDLIIDDEGINCYNEKVLDFIKNYEEGN